MGCINKRMTLFVFFILFVAICDNVQAKSGRVFVRSEDVIPFIPKAARIDGKLDDSVWKEATRIDEFYQYTPLNGATPTEKTVAYLYYDKNNLYVAYRCYDSDPSKIRATLTPRNQWVNNDYVFIYLDTYDSKRDQYLFQINPLGVQKNSFDTIWYSGAVIDSLGWTGEMAIPFKSLRFPDEKEQEWGYELGRNVYRKGETINYLDCRYNEDYNSMFHLAKGLKNLPRGHNIEFLPYSAGKHSIGRDFEEKEAALGLDAKFGLATNLTLDASFAPDFSQVESDPFFVNFSPYEYQLSENRPFFNEGGATFSLPYTLFYSRRIQNPKTMLKLTGKEGPWNIGVINAWDNPDQSGDRLVHTERLQRDILKTSKIGFMVSGIEDGVIYNRNMSIDGQFHRDAVDHLQFQFASTFNSDADNTNNTLFYINHSHTPIYGFTYNISYLDIAPDYNPKTGIIGQKGYRNPSMSMGYQWHLPEWGIETLSITSSGNYSRSYSDLDIGKSGGMSISCGLIRKINANMGFTSSNSRAQIIRNNILAWNPDTFTSKSFNTSLSSNTGSIFDGNLSYSFSDGGGIYINDYQDQAAGMDQNIGCGFTFQPASNIMFKNTANWYHQKLKESGAVVYDNVFLYNSLHYQITRKLYSRIIQNVDIDGNSHMMDFLVGYEFHAGSTFYVSYKELRDQSGGDFSRENYMIFGKMSYLFRI